MEASLRKSLSQLQRAKEERDKQTKLKQLQYRLKQEETQRNQLHLERQKQRKNQEAMKRLESETQRIQKVEAERQQLSRDRSAKLQQMAHQKMDLQSEIMQYSVTNRIDMETVKRLAQEYDINFKAIKHQYIPSKKHATRLPKIWRVCCVNVHFTANNTR